MGTRSIVPQVELLFCLSVSVSVVRPKTDRSSSRRRNLAVITTPEVSKRETRKVSERTCSGRFCSVYGLR